MLGWWETQPQEEQGGGIDAIALDGDKLKPREDQRKGGNGFGINEEGAGYTLTGVDRHGVAYCADGGEVAATITRQISEQSGQDNRANAVVQCYENHATDARVRKVDIAPTMGSTQNAQPDNNNPLIVSTNSNGEDVAATINANMSKLGGDNQTTFGGGYVVSKAKEGAEGE